MINAIFTTNISQGRVFFTHGQVTVFAIAAAAAVLTQPRRCPWKE